MTPEQALTLIRDLAKILFDESNNGSLDISKILSSVAQNIYSVFYGADEDKEKK